ncbi:hypothetical protein Q4555_14380 [Octadecabacter sp. 1_MG-2023]|uniref:hypothetical protein n=1 Tax=unclassified Octadecabacter TaxID=196158 RepID=UPI001C083B6A|nr:MULTISPECIES: hypothetical protein [unclassified Octadecabacter]MBU2991888.1 hypothetical protein [Octadecabacter sp. B2R22]MDO6735862.1 hypothetical protein [Octadecabacter sp. 1_MG-2023]
MIRINTPDGPIDAEAEIRGIPINPLNPPTMEHVAPIRRWENGSERVWARQPWIVEVSGGFQVFCIQPAQTYPTSWGVFETLQKAAFCILDAPETPVQVSWLESDLDF